MIRRAEARKKGLGKRAEAADYWRRYLANDCQAEWAAGARAIIEVLRDAGPFDRFCLTSAACPECVKSHGTEPQARIASCALRRPTLLSDMLTANFGNLLQKLRQLGDIHRDPARLTAQADIETAPRASAAT